MDVFYLWREFTSPHKFLPWSSESLQSPLKLYEALWSSMKPSEALWSPPKPSEALWSPPKPSEDFWSLLKTSEDLWRPLKLYDDLWRSMTPSEALWRPLKLYDDLWSSMKPSKALWRTLQISLHISRMTDRSKKSFCLSSSLLIQRRLSDKLFSVNEIVICHQSSHNISVCVLFIPRILSLKINFKHSIIKCNFSSLELS